MVKRHKRTIGVFTGACRGRVVQHWLHLQRQLRGPMPLILKTSRDFHSPSVMIVS